MFADDLVVASADDGVTWRALPLPHAAFGSPGNARFTCIAEPDRIVIAALDGLYAVRAPW